MNASREIKSVSDILNMVKADYNGVNELWFRGQPVHDYRLLPSVFRQGKEFGITYEEGEMYREFIRRHPSHGRADWKVTDWLTLMQHYGLPTRLLDWTTSLLVALYFICIEKQHEDGALFAICPDMLGQDTVSPLHELQVSSTHPDKFYEKLFAFLQSEYGGMARINGMHLSEIAGNAFDLGLFVLRDPSRALKSVEVKSRITERYNVIDGSSGERKDEVYDNITESFSKIIALKAPHLSDRAKYQHARFTLHGGAFFNGQPYIPVADLEKSVVNGRLKKWHVAADLKKQLLEELFYFGVREATLFPEMDKQARDIVSQLSRKT